MIAAARPLPPEDWTRLRDWIESQERRAASPGAEAQEKDEAGFQEGQ
jgi:hypothetical protein